MATEKELYQRALAKLGDPDKAAAFVADYLSKKAPEAKPSMETKPTNAAQKGDASVRPMGGSKGAVGKPAVTMPGAAAPKVVSPFTEESARAYLAGKKYLPSPNEDVVRRATAMKANDTSPEHVAARYFGPTEAPPAVSAPILLTQPGKASEAVGETAETAKAYLRTLGARDDALGKYDDATLIRTAAAERAKRAGTQ